MTSMKVAIDIGPLSSGHAVRGVGKYTKELINALEKETKNLPAGRQGVEELEINVFDFTDKERLITDGYDIIHYPFFNPFFITLPSAKQAKLIVTIHDLIPLIYPKNYPPGIRGKVRFYIQRELLKKVDAIITVSETSKKDIVRFLGVPQVKIQVIYEGVGKSFRVITDRDKLKEIAQKYSLPENFVLYVGDINYNKNIPTLIEGCNKAKIPLVICGKQAANIDSLGGLDTLHAPMDYLRFLLGKPHPELAHYRKLIELFKNKNVIRLGFVPEDDLVSIYNLATIYCQPSFYEGFGIPVLEAFACETPVVIARTQALVEVADKGAIVFDPKDSSDLAIKLKRLIGESSERTRLIREGNDRLKYFSWERAAKETIEVYKKLTA
jgi:glycosyltransferase involved in cell wall biosynthesis